MAGRERNRAEDARLAAAIGHMATPLGERGERYDVVLQHIGDANIVLLGEATHGTHEFYNTRAAITRRLIEEKGFSAVCIEGDYPHAERVHRYLSGNSDDRNANDALAGFQRFPQWMWRNTDVVAMVESLKASKTRVGFYGLDLYSLHESMAAVLAHLDRVDPEEAKRARARYACFDHYGEDPQAYGMVTSGLGGAASCEEEVVQQLVAMQARRMEHGDFDAEMNARVVRNAEAYYRTMFRGRVSSWNLRDTHMMETLDAVLQRIGESHWPPKVVVWAHNSHLGDARATEMGEEGELNLGQLVRQRYGRAARLIGFSTYEGSVTAANDWDAPAERMRVRRGMVGSYEALFHEVSIERFFLDLRDLGEASGALRDSRLQRAIGVVYRPDSERLSHYFHARIAEQFDAILHFDRTCAVVPLEREGMHDDTEAPETYPSSL
jgi:erythromycin esterase-like protein